MLIETGGKVVYKLNFLSERPVDLIGIGRLTVDLNADQINRPMEETSSFTKYVGGSPTNISIGTARLDLNTGFIGKVSDDQLGRFIINYFNDNGVDTSGISIDKYGSVIGLSFIEINS